MKDSVKASSGNEKARSSQETSGKALLPKGHGNLRGPGHFSMVVIAISVQSDGVSQSQ